MERWEKAVQQFLKDWTKRKEFSGAMACGSYVTGNPNKHSDIDLHIITKAGTKWRERGNKIVNGFLIEYFCNPPEQILKYFEEDYEKNGRMSPTMFVTGRTLIDKQDDIVKLKKQARKYILKKFERPGKVSTELAKYSAWDAIDNVKSHQQRDSSSFYLVYFDALNQVYKTYAKHLKVIISGVDKVEGILTDEKTRKKYLQKEFPDKKFIQYFLEALKIDNKNIMTKRLEKVGNYSLKKMGRLKVDGWKIKSPVSK